MDRLIGFGGCRLSRFGGFGFDRRGRLGLGRGLLIRDLFHRVLVDAGGGLAGRGNDAGGGGYGLIGREGRAA